MSERAQPDAHAQDSDTSLEGVGRPCACCSLALAALVGGPFLLYHRGRWALEWMVGGPDASPRLKVLVVAVAVTFVLALFGMLTAGDPREQSWPGGDSSPRAFAGLALACLAVLLVIRLVVALLTR